MNDYDSINEYNKKSPSMNQDIFQQETLAGLWLTMYLKDLETYNFLIKSFKNLTGFIPSSSHDDLEDKFEELMDYGRRLNNRILNDCIRKKEEFLAKLIIQYDCYITEEGLYYIIKYEMLSFLNKNFKILSPKMWSNDEITQEINFIKSENGEIDNIEIEKITYKDIFKKINDIIPLKREEISEKIINWKIHSRENILEALLLNGLDRVAIKHLHEYQNDLNFELLYSAICNKNEEFLKKCMMSQYISRMIFYEKEILSKIVDLFKYGDSLALGANLINALNPNTIDIIHSKNILVNITNIFKQHRKNDQLLFCNNPIISMALICEMINNIGKRHHSLDIKCKGLFKFIQEFSYIYIDTIEDNSYYTSLMNQKDFYERTSLDIIVENKFTKMIKDEKTGLKFSNLWEGPNCLDFDKGIDSVSIIHHLVWSRLDFSKSSSAFSFISEELNKNSINFSLQNKYRRFYSVFYFYYEFFYSLIVLIFFQNINLNYVKSYIRNEGMNTVNQNIVSTYTNPSLSLSNFYDINSFIFSYNIMTFSPIWLKLSIVLVIFNLFSPINRFIFTMLSKKLHRWDWTLFLDLLINIFNLVNMCIIYGSLYDETGSFDYVKRHPISMTYFMTIVICFNWIKLYLNFQYLQGTSALIKTLFYIIQSTLYFLVLLICYFLIVATFFFILYSKLLKDYFATFSLSLNTLFDAMFFSYNHPRFDNAYDTEQYDLVLRILFSLHVFISGVLLVNYLVAILSSVFSEIMDEEEERDFCYYSSIYSYSNKFRPGMLDSTYGHYLLILPPFNIISLLTTIFVYFDSYNTIVKIIEFVYFLCTSIMMFFLYLIYLCILCPLLFLKAFTMILRTNLKFSNRALLFMSWIVIGGVVILMTLIRDLFNFIIIFSRNYKPERHSKLEIDYERKLFIEIFNQSKMLFNLLSRKFKKECDEGKSLFISVPSLLNFFFSQKLDEKVYNMINKVNDYRTKKSNINFMYNILGTNNLTLKHAGNVIKGDMQSYEISLKDNKVFKKTFLDIAEKIEKFVNNFAIPTIKGDVISVQLMKVIYDRTIHYSNIDKILQINFKIMGSSLNKLDNQNPYGILEFFENLNKNRWTKLKEKVLILYKKVKQILKNRGHKDINNITKELKHKLSIINNIEKTNNNKNMHEERIKEEQNDGNFVFNLIKNVEDKDRKHPNIKISSNKINSEEKTTELNKNLPEKK